MRKLFSNPLDIKILIVEADQAQQAHFLSRAFLKLCLLDPINLHRRKSIVFHLRLIVSAKDRACLTIVKGRSQSFSFWIYFFQIWDTSLNFNIMKFHCNFWYCNQ